jgi:hypothetical protein
MLLTVILPVAPSMYWRRTFPGRADQSHEVRAFAATLIPDHPRLDDVLLAAGELVANALRHTKSGQGGSFTVDLFHTGGRTSISVGDQGGPSEPMVTEAGSGPSPGAACVRSRCSPTAGAGTVPTPDVLSLPSSPRRQAGDDFLAGRSPTFVTATRGRPLREDDRP